MDILQKPRHLLHCVLILSFASCAVAQVTTPMEIAKETKLPRDVHDLVAIGGPDKRIQCDAEENIWIPAFREYSATVSSLVRFGPKKATIHIDIDQEETLKNGSIEFFSPLNDGGVLALVTTVAVYNELNGSPTTPKRYLNTFAVTFASSGTISNIVQLKLPSGPERVTALVRLKNGWLVAGYTNSGPFIEMRAYLLDPAGSFTNEVMLPENRSKASMTGSAGSTEVFRPTAMTTSSGDVLVFRGFSSQPFYRISETGSLIEWKKLQPDGVEFWSPRLIGDSLLVTAGVSPEKTGDLGGIPIVRYRSAFPIFDLKTGQITEVLTWMDQGTVGCYDGTRLLVFKQDDGPTWRILTLERATPKTHPPKT